MMLINYAKRASGRRARSATSQLPFNWKGRRDIASVVRVAKAETRVPSEKSYRASIESVPEAVQAQVAAAMADDHSHPDGTSSASSGYDRRKRAYFFRGDGIQFFCKAAAELDSSLEFCGFPWAFGSIVLYRFRSEQPDVMAGDTDNFLTSRERPDWVPVLLRNSDRVLCASRSRKWKDGRNTTKQVIARRFRFSLCRNPWGLLHFCTLPSRHKIFSGSRTRVSEKPSLCFAESDAMTSEKLLEALRAEYAKTVRRSRNQWVQHLAPRAGSGVMGMSLQCMMVAEEKIYRRCGLPLDFPLGYSAGPQHNSSIGPYLAFHRKLVRSSGNHSSRNINLNVSASLGDGKLRALTDEELQSLDIVCGLHYDCRDDHGGRGGVPAGVVRPLGVFLFPRDVAINFLRGARTGSPENTSLVQERRRKAEAQPRYIVVYPPESTPKIARAIQLKEVQQDYYIDMRPAADVNLNIEKARRIFQKCSEAAADQALGAAPSRQRTGTS